MPKCAGTSNNDIIAGWYLLVTAPLVREVGGACGAQGTQGGLRYAPASLSDECHLLG